MKHPMRVLIAHDGSESADAAVEDLSRAGCRDGTEALVLSVSDLWLPQGKPDVNPAVARIFPGLKTGRDKAKAALSATRAVALRAAERVGRLNPSWKVRSEARAGSPGWVIFDRAASWKPHLTVLGSHGRSAFDRWTLGSVSHQVLLVMTGSVRIARAHPPRGDRPPRILIGWDGSRGSDLARKAVGGRVWPEGTEVRVVTVLEAPLVPRPGRENDGVWERRVEEVAQRLEARGRTVSSFVREGKPRDVLLEEAETWKADAIFLGARGLTPWKSFVLGSVSSAVAARARCSVEVVRQGFWTSGAGAAATGGGR